MFTVEPIADHPQQHLQVVHCETGVTWCETVQGRAWIIAAALNRYCAMVSEDEELRNTTI